MKRSFLPIALLMALPTYAEQQGPGDITDTLLMEEISHLGGYPEMARPFGTNDLVNVPLWCWSPWYAQFSTDGLRVRIESQPFPSPSDIQRSEAQAFLEGVPMIGWGPRTVHTRLSRLEVVVDGMVLSPPVESVIDVFDARPCEAYGSGVLQFTSAARSADGDRIYVQVLAGHGAEARLVTWVFENGAYLLRLVDRFRVPG